jgi:hypothetical protein
MQHGSIRTLRDEVLAALNEQSAENCARLDAQLDASHLDDDTTSALLDLKSSIPGTAYRPATGSPQRTLRARMIHDPEGLGQPSDDLFGTVLVRQPPFPYRGWQLFRFDPGRGVNTTEG